MSQTLTQGQLYDAASTILQQKLLQVDGVGDVNVWGSSLPAVRVEMNPSALFKYGVGLEDVRAALSAANANSPKGAIEDSRMHWQIYDNDQSRSAKDYRDLVVAYRNGSPVRLHDVADISDSIEDIRNTGLSKGHPAVIVAISRQPQANIIATVDRVRALLPRLKTNIPPATELVIASDRSTVIRASLRAVETSLAIAMILVVIVVFLFLRDGRAVLVPAVAVPVSLVGTFGAMYLLGYSLDNLSLMALTIATGFVVDDAIVVMENIVRNMEAGVPRFQAALIGVRQVGFTVLSMSLSLIAVFIPILLMGGVFGLYFREFAVTLSIAILISMVISLTTTPMMCARLLSVQRPISERGAFHRLSEGGFQTILADYRKSLAWVLDHKFPMLMVFLSTVVLTVWLFIIIPKGFFPEQDTGRMFGFIQADQSTSFQRISDKLRQYMKIVQDDKDVDEAVGFTGAGGGGGNSGRMFISLKPLGVRKDSTEQIMARLRPGVSLDLVLRPDHDAVLRLRERDVGEDHRDAGLAGCVDRGHQRSTGDRFHDYCVDALADHLLDRRDLLLRRRGGDRGRDVHLERARHEALLLGRGELGLEAGNHMQVVGVGRRERDVTDLPRALDRLGMSPRARNQRARVARVDRLERRRERLVDSARVRRTDRRAEAACVGCSELRGLRHGATRAGDRNGRSDGSRRSDRDHDAGSPRHDPLTFLGHPHLSFVVL